MATHEPTTDEGLTLGRLDDGRPTSTEEFADALHDEPWTCERVDGRLVVLPPHATDHVLSADPWLRRLVVSSHLHPEEVETVVPYAWIRIDPQNDRIADIAVYREGLDIPDQIPELVFEFVSPREDNARRKYVEKRAHYEAIGVREYGIVDRFDRKVTVLTLADGKYAEQVLTGADAYRSPFLPGFEVRLAEALLP